MKITKEQLQQITREELQKLLKENFYHDMDMGQDDDNYVSAHIHDENCSHDVEDGEAEMFKSHLYTLAKQSQELNDLVEEHEDIEEWVQEKIAVAASMIDSVYNYLSYQKEGEEYEQRDMDEQSDYVSMDPANYVEYDYGYGGNLLDEESEEEA
jgi:hypothetical protein